MQLKIGNTGFLSNACDIKAYIETLRNRGGQPYATKQRLDVSGFLQVTGQADCTQQMNQLASVLAVPYQDLVFYQDDGSPSATGLGNAGSISGVIITRGPSFPGNMGGEYSSYRKFEFTAEAEYPLPGSLDLLLNFTERLSFGGGRPLRTIMLAVSGPHQLQTIYPTTPYTLIQQGEAIGYQGYPNPAAMLYPGNLMEPEDIEEVSPDKMGRGHQGYKVTWRYKFQSLKPMPATPHFWI